MPFRIWGLRNYRVEGIPELGARYWGRYYKGLGFRVYGVLTIRRSYYLGHSRGSLFSQTGLGIGVQVEGLELVGDWLGLIRGAQGLRGLRFAVQVFCLGPVDMARST